MPQNSISLNLEIPYSSVQPEEEMGQVFLELILTNPA